MKTPTFAPRDERDFLDQLETELRAQFGGQVPDAAIQKVAADSLRRFDRVRIKDYVLILAMRAARGRLRSQVAAPA